MKFSTFAFLLEKVKWNLHGPCEFSADTFPKHYSNKNSTGERQSHSALQLTIVITGLQNEASISVVYHFVWLAQIKIQEH